MKGLLRTNQKVEVLFPRNHEKTMVEVRRENWLAPWSEWRGNSSLVAGEFDSTPNVFVVVIVEQCLIAHFD
jgi:hypothetical protein